MCIAALEETSPKTDEQNVQPTESAPASKDRTGPSNVLYKYISLQAFYQLGY